MSKLSFEKERISGTDRAKQNPFKVETHYNFSVDDAREKLGRTRYSQLHYGDDPRASQNPFD